MRIALWIKEPEGNNASKRLVRGCCMQFCPVLARSKLEIKWLSGCLANLTINRRQGSQEIACQPQIQKGRTPQAAG